MSHVPAEVGREKENRQTLGKTGGFRKDLGFGNRSEFKLSLLY